MRFNSRLALSTTTGVISIVVIIAVAAVASALILTSNTGAPATGGRQSVTSSQSSVSQTSTTSSSSSAPSSAAIQKVTLIPPFLPNSEDAPYYYGIEKGIYRQNGIDLTILQGSGSAFAVTAIAAGKADFVISDMGTFIASSSNANVSSVRVVAIVYPRATGIVLYNKAVIHTISDLNNKTGATFQGSGLNLVFPLFAKINGLNLGSIKFQYASPATYLQALTLGKVDFALTAFGSIAELNTTAAKNRVQLGMFPVADWGLDFYGQSILTTTQMIQARPDTVRRFVNATMYSLYLEVKDPQGTADSAVAFYPGFNRTLFFQNLQLWNKYILANASKTSNPLTLGWIDQGKMQKTVDIVKQAYSLTNIPPASDLYTDDFVRHP